jgi:hypothetical protein
MQSAAKPIKQTIDIISWIPTFLTLAKMASNTANTTDHSKRIVSVMLADGRVMPEVEFLPHVLITDPAILERLTKTHQPVEHVTPRRMTFISYGSCDYCGPMPDGKESASMILPGDPFTGIITCDNCKDKAAEDIKAYCSKTLRFVITTQKLADLGLAGDFKVKRSSGEVEPGWRVNTGDFSYATTFEKDGKICIPVVNRLLGKCRGSTLDDICSVNNLNFEELSEKIREM